MPRPEITFKITVTRILKEHLYEGKSGKYLDVVAWPNKNGPDQYGNTHFLTQEVSREAREKGIKGPIIGNAKIATPAPQQRQVSRPPARPPVDPDLDAESDRIPF